MVGGQFDLSRHQLYRGSVGLDDDVLLGGHFHAVGAGLDQPRQKRHVRGDKRLGGLPLPSLGGHHPQQFLDL